MGRHCFIVADVLLLYFYVKLTGNCFDRHSILDCQLNDLLNLLFFGFARLTRRLGSKDILLFSFQCFNPFLNSSDLGIIIADRCLFLCFKFRDRLIQLFNFATYLSSSFLWSTTRTLLLQKKKIIKGKAENIKYGSAAIKLIKSTGHRDKTPCARCFYPLFN